MIEPFFLSGDENNTILISHHELSFPVRPALFNIGQIHFYDYGSNYNFAINLYNEAAYRIGKIPPEADLTHIMLEQAGCIEIFKQALPIAKTAEELRPGRIEILKALRAIHLSLSNYDEFDRYNRLVREKQGELIIDSKVERELDRKYFGQEKVDDK